MRTVTAAIALFLILSSCATQSARIEPEDVSGEPDKFCTVINEPDPILMGGWECDFTRFLMKKGEYDYNPIAYWLVKRGDRYALYFYRTAHQGQKSYTGWKAWTIDGSQIYSDTGVRIFTEDGRVYFSFQNYSPVQMTRFAD